MLINVKIKLLEGGVVPEYKTSGAACADCFASKDMVVLAGRRARVPLGFCIEVPSGYKASIKPRSGLTVNKGIDIALGTVDSDYRGEVCAILINNSDDTFNVNKGERICQIEIEEVVTAKFEQVSVLSDTKRGEGGFGHTGIN